MKIESTPYAANLVRPNTTPAKTTDKPETRQESVSLSSREAVTVGTAPAPTNNAKIAEIKEAIAQGRFKINPEAIAGSLIETARDLLNSQRKA